MSDCYNRNLELAKELEKVHGRLTTNLLYHMNGRKLPTIQEAKKLVENKGERYGDLRETQRWNVPAGVVSLADVYAILREKKQELEDQGAQISNITSTGFSYLLPENLQTTDGIPSKELELFGNKNIYYQKPLNTNQDESEKRELRGIFTGRIPGKEGESIQTAYSYFRGDTATGEGASESFLQGDGQTDKGGRGGDQKTGIQEIHKRGVLETFPMGRLTDYQKLTTNQKLKYELQSKISRAVSTGKSEGKIGNALFIFRAAKEAGQGIPSGGQGLIWYWDQIKKAGLEYTKSLGEPWSKGGEHEVYESDNNKKLVKVKFDLDDVDDMEIYLKKLLIYNHLFKNTAYNLLGFIKRGSNVEPVVEQDIIQKTEKFDKDIVDSVLSNYGFTKISDFEYTNKELGISIDDIFPRNVFFNSGIPYFIDPIIGIEASFYQPAIKSKPNIRLDKRLKSFMQSIGGNITHVPDRGQDYAAYIDTINRAITVVDGKAGEATLGHEVIHQFVDLVELDNPLLADIIKAGKMSDQFDEIYKQYKDDKDYQHADGSVDEDKIAKEAFAHMADDILVGKYKNARAQSIWNRLWQWIKNFVGRIREKLGGKSFTAENLPAAEYVAEEILGGHTGALSKEKLKLIKAANERGEIYYQLAPRDEAYIKGVRAVAGKPQQKVIDDIYMSPEVVLDKDSHIYSNRNNPDDIYKSVTVLLNGKTHLDQEDFKLNKDLGNDFDAIMQGIALGKKVGEIEDITTLQGDQIQKAYDILNEYYRELVSPGDVVLTQVIVHDPVTKVAGSIDLLVIKPDGSTAIVDLKTMRKGRSYTTGMTTGEGSLITEPLSRRQKHAIQVATYRRLLAIMGYPGARISAVYVDMDISGERREQVLLGFSKGDIVNFTESSWDNYARMIVPTEPTIDKTKPEQLFSEEEVTSEQEPPETVPDEEVITKVDKALDKADTIFNNRLRYFKAMLKGGGGIVPRQTTINDINNLIYEVGNLKAKGQKQAAYGRIINHAQKEVNEWSAYINKVKNYEEPQYFSVVDEVSKFLDSYRGLFRIRTGLNEGQEKMLQSLILSLEDLQTSIVNNSWNYIKHKAGKVLPKLTEEQLVDMLQFQKDISKKALLGSDIAGSRDMLLAALDTRVKQALDIIYRTTDQIHEQIEDKANQFVQVIGGKVTDKSFDFMYEDNRIVQKVSPDYYKIQNDIYSRLEDENDEQMQPKIILDTATAKPEDIQYNKDLWYKKQAVRKFRAAEEIIDGVAEDGDYHKFTDEYKSARDQVMVLIDRDTFSTWERRLNISDDHFNAFRKRYQVHRPYWRLLTVKNPETGKREPTGVVTWISDGDAWFPQDQYIVIRDEARDGTDLVNPRYQKLMTPKTPIEQAQKQVYEYYIKTIGEYADKIGPDAVKWMKRGDMIALRGDFIQQSKEQGVWKTVKGYIRNQFTPTIYGSTVTTDETGTVRQTIPRLYMNGTQKQQRVDNLTSKLELLKDQKANNKISIKEYNVQSKELKYQLAAERAKPTSDQLEHDIFKQMLAYTEMAENFIIRDAIQGEVIAFVRAIEGDIINPETGVGRQYFDVNARDKEITQAGTKERAFKKDPNTVKRVNAYISQVFYGEQDMTKSTAEALAKRVMNYTSLIGVGLNLFGNINNYMVGKLAGTIEMAGAKYFQRDAYWRAQKQFLPAGELIIGFARKLGTAKEGPYSHRQPQSLSEALIKKYRVVREQKSGEERVTALGWLPYKGAQLGEYVVQGIPGLAVLMSSDASLNSAIRTMINNKTGEVCSIYDAHIFDPNTGELSLRDDFTETPDELFRTTNYIFEVNKHIHGSYAPEDVVMLQKDILGKMIMQFHKHIMPALRHRFAAPYEHITLGEYEGRWTSVVSFAKKVKDFDGTWKEKVTDGWDDLSPVQKKNILQDGAELLTLLGLLAMYSIVSGISKGLNPDEDPTLKRWANFLSYQFSRLYAEQIAYTPTPMGAVQMYQYVKNPMAMTTTLRNFSNLLLTGIELPFQINYTDMKFDKEAIYQNGPYKGQLKLRHQFNKLIPVLNNLDKWSGFSQLNRFSLVGT